MELQGEMRASGDCSAMERRASSWEIPGDSCWARKSGKRQTGEKGGGKIIKIEQVISLERRGPLEQQSLHLNA